MPVLCRPFLTVSLQGDLGMDALGHRHLLQRSIEQVLSLHVNRVPSRGGGRSGASSAHTSPRRFDRHSPRPQTAPAAARTAVTQQHAKLAQRLEKAKLRTAQQIRWAAFQCLQQCFQLYDSRSCQ